MPSFRSLLFVLVLPVLLALSVWGDQVSPARSPALTHASALVFSPAPEIGQAAPAGTESTPAPTPTATPAGAATPTPASAIYLPAIRKTFTGAPEATATFTASAVPSAATTATPTPTATSTTSASPTASLPAGAPRPWPDTSSGIHVFNDQLATGLSEAQTRFAATRYDGSQKLTHSQVEQIRAISPGFVMLNYRLGHGLGYRGIQASCSPTGEWLMVVEGDNWVQEWPGEANVTESWLYHWPPTTTTRVLNCDWGWYLAELNDAGWRAYWHGEVLRQVGANHADGVFMDSLSVPSYLGNDHYSPHLPAVDASLEAAWTARIRNWLVWLQGQPLGQYYLVPNAGSWVTTRDATDYSSADGVMIEGFAIQSDANPFNLEDWRLQMNRSLGLIAQNKALIGQSTAVGSQERMFALGSYLLIKGSRTYLNIELDLTPEWWAEYDIPIGSPGESAGAEIDNLYRSTEQVYRRRFDRGMVLVNPTSPWDGTGVTPTVALTGTMYLAQPAGGGEVPENGVPTGSVSYSAVSSVALPPYSAAVVLYASP